MDHMLKIQLTLAESIGFALCEHLRTYRHRERMLPEWCRTQSSRNAIVVEWARQIDNERLARGGEPNTDDWNDVSYPRRYSLNRICDDLAYNMIWFVGEQAQLLPDAAVKDTFERLDSCEPHDDEMIGLRD